MIARARKRHVQCRIRPSARSFGLFAAEGSIKIAKLGELAKADRQPALALTDTDNMFGALEFSDKMAGYGIQPIVGCELAIDFGDQDRTRATRWLPAPSRIVLLAAREARLPQPDAAELARLPGDADPSRRRTSSSTGSRARPRT